MVENREPLQMGKSNTKQVHRNTTQATVQQQRVRAGLHTALLWRDPSPSGARPASNSNNSSFGQQPCRPQSARHTQDSCLGCCPQQVYGMAGNSLPQPEWKLARYMTLAFGAGENASAEIRTQQTAWIRSATTLLREHALAAIGRSTGLPPARSQFGPPNKNQDTKCSTRYSRESNRSGQPTSAHPPTHLVSREDNTDNTLKNTVHGGPWPLFPSTLLAPSHTKR